MTHEPWNELLARHVDEAGRVAYRRLAERDAAALDRYLDTLAQADPEALPRPQQIAFWLNAYNANVVKGVLSGHDAEGFLARKRFFDWFSFPLAGRKRTLAEIEHGILRRRYDEPRIHFALVCASTSCPKLRREAYSGERLDEQLDDQARRFLGDPRRNRIGAGGEIRISRIFEWFAGDFVKAAGSVPAFIGRYVSVPENPRIEYMDYDWTMNAQEGQRP